MNICDDEGCVHERTAHTYTVIQAGSKLRQVMQDVTRAVFDVHPKVEMKVHADDQKVQHSGRKSSGSNKKRNTST